MNRIIVIAACSWFASCALWGQPVSAPLTFEVASIKPSAGEFRGTVIQAQPGGGLRVIGATVKALVAYTYNVRDFQISGGPDWVNSDRYNIVAKPQRSTGPEDLSDALRSLSAEQRKTYNEQMGQRVQALMADRFHLMVHRETKEQPVYTLVISKNGSKLQPAAASDAPGRIRMGRGELTGEAVQVQMLAAALANVVDRPVIDKTGLSGNFNLKLEWTPDPGQSPGNPGPPPAGAAAQPPSDPNRPSIFTALQEQLGLRLESDKGPVEMIVIDHVEKPSEN
ncbi:MAG TPA: TIGR03435 family protein [Bryobacteraceae bacterium]|nr:TIGR03435 family protein [Bryobacteraceae bacterium]